MGNTPVAPMGATFLFFYDYVAAKQDGNCAADVGFGYAGFGYKLREGDPIVLFSVTVSLSPEDPKTAGFVIA